MKYIIRYSTLTVPADAEFGTLVTLLWVEDQKGQPIPAHFALPARSRFVISGDALLTGQWDETQPPLGKYTVYVTATSIAGGSPLGSLEIVLHIVRPLGGKITAKRPDGTVVTGGGPDDMIFTPRP